MKMNRLKIINRFINSNFTKSVMLIAGGTAAAQIINIIMTPIVARLYLPEEFGVLSLYVALLGIISTIASLRYEWSIPVAEDDEEAVNMVGVSVFVLALFTILTGIILFVTGKSIMVYFNAEDLWDYSYMIPLGLFVIGLYNIIMQWALREKNFKGISKTKFSQAFFQNILKVVLGLVKFGSVGLILGNIVGQSAGISTLAISSSRGDKKLLLKINIKKMLQGAKRYIKFPIFSASSQFFNSAGIQLPVILMTTLYGSEMVGFYGLTSSIINIPMVLIGNSVGDVFYGEAASIGRKDPERLKSLSAKLFKKLFLLGLVPLISLLLFGPILFSFVFGSDWKQSGIYAQILSVLVFARLVFTPISRLYTVFERQKEAFLLDLFRVVLVVAVFGVAWIFEISSYISVGMYSISMTFVYLLTYLIAQRILNEEIKKLNLPTF